MAHQKLIVARNCKLVSIDLVHFGDSETITDLIAAWPLVLQITTVQLRERLPPLTCAASLRVAAEEATMVIAKLRDDCHVECQR